ncbi:putative transcription factor bHLH family [Helianthus annuus]|uniref:Putative myc-type, basic helix-loop-helix (BHLH) domain-containing protein n=1 Tax=Helianthus annuus TaxID=4232 RepID=A0A251USV8_HELAN|nr:transcription factor bHLH123 [Helianthus annuus]KAF5807396.1 putative transcription factor bHLH family [Helianthus annuus]KAJ0585883.1 putative transcription factor bHLH family [Helianthus annuus]KAJ0920525.1 putative transcription factor bHLH family [Helianthus annuus]
MADSWWDSRTRPCLNNSVSVTSMNLFQETTDSTTTTATCSGGRGGDGGLLESSPNLQMMELGLSSQPISHSLDWNQALYHGDQRNDHHQSGYQTLIQEDHGLSSNTSRFQENQWKSHKMYSGSPSEFKQINVRGARLDEHARYNDENRLNPGFQPMDDHSYGSNSTLIQSLFGSDSNTSVQQDSSYDQNQGISYSYPPSYGGMTVSGGGGGEEYALPPPQQEFSTNSSPSKVQGNIAAQLHFSNNARFWNVSASNFFPLQMQSASSTIEDKPKNPISEMVKKSNTKSSSTKRPRNENPPMPPLKVKMGDRITALQQLVSPFGKTDTASVLSEAIVYIKFLHEQVNVLSTPYMNNVAIMQQQKQISDKPSDGSRQDLRSRGLCLVPISSTFPVTNETPVDFWTPSFGGTFR